MLRHILLLLYIYIFYNKMLKKMNIMDIIFFNKMIKKKLSEQGYHLLEENVKGQKN